MEPMKSYEPHLGEKEVNVLNKIITILFGEDVYCSHGSKGSDGVCMDCCNDLYTSDDDLADVLDFPPM